VGLARFLLLADSVPVFGYFCGCNTFSVLAVNFVVLWYYWVHQRAGALRQWKSECKNYRVTGASAKASVKITMSPAPKLYSAKPSVVKCIFDSSAQSSEKI
jgi:hypothetical protein